MLTLWQTEWCRGSQQVRQRLTELGVDVIIRQVAAEPSRRYELLSRFNETSVPLLEVPDGKSINGTEDILAWLGEHYEDAEDVDQHRARAERSFAKRCAEFVPS